MSDTEVMSSPVSITIDQDLEVSPLPSPPLSSCSPLPLEDVSQSDTSDMIEYSGGGFHDISDVEPDQWGHDEEYDDQLELDESQTAAQVRHRLERLISLSGDILGGNFEAPLPATPTALEGEEEGENAMKPTQFILKVENSQGTVDPESNVQLLENQIYQISPHQDPIPPIELILAVSNQNEFDLKICSDDGFGVPVATGDDNGDEFNDFGDFGDVSDDGFEAYFQDGAQVEGQGDDGEDAWASFNNPTTNQIPAIIQSDSFDHLLISQGSNTHSTMGDPNGIITSWFNKMEQNDLYTWCGDLLNFVFHNKGATDTASPPEIGITKDALIICTHVLRENRQRFVVSEDRHKVFNTTGTSKPPSETAAAKKQKKATPPLCNITGSRVQLQSLKAIGFRMADFKEESNQWTQDQLKRQALKHLTNQELQKRLADAEQLVKHLESDNAQASITHNILVHENSVKQSLIASLLELIRRTKHVHNTHTPPGSPNGALKLLTPGPSNKPMKILRNTNTLMMSALGRFTGHVSAPSSQHSSTSLSSASRSLCSSHAGAISKTGMTLPISDQTIRNGVRSQPVPIIPYKANLATPSCLQLGPVIDSILANQGSVQDTLADYIATL